jgi:CheY-like chemotaxis protein
MNEPTSHFTEMPVRVLLVEDDRGYAEMIRAAFDESIVKIVGVAYDGQSALAMWHALHPDALICDLHLPGVNGPDVIRAIRQQDQDAIVIAITGTGDNDLAAAAREAGAQEVFRKQDYPPAPTRIQKYVNGEVYE